VTGIARELRRTGASVVLSSFGDGWRMLSREFTDVPVYRVPTIEVISPSGSFRLSHILRRCPDLPIRFYAGVGLDLKIIRHHGCRVVVSDCQFHALAAARMLDVPSVMITNVLRLPGDGPSSRLVNWFLRETLQLADLVIVPDVPDGESPPSDVDVVWVGPILRASPDELPGRESIRERLNLPKERPIVLITAGGSRYGGRIVRLAMEGIRRLEEDVYVIVVDDGIGSGTLRGVSGLAFNYVDNLLELIRAADVVVTHGGHTTISECACLRTPVVSIPLPNHPEQQMNALRAEKRGLGVALQPQNLSPDRVAEAIRRAMGIRVPRIKLMDGKGAVRAARIIRETMSGSP
jgi:UDP:flavonoid glycosyltransferase YjiC (YdhE family)